MPALRLTVPILPVVYILWADALHKLVEQIDKTKQRIFLGYCIILGSLILTASSFYLPKMLPTLKYNKTWYYGSKIGLYFRENSKPEETIAINAAGAIAYYSKIRCIDMLGLCDKEIAHRKDIVIGPNLIGHEKYDGVYVIRRAPEYIMFGDPMKVDGDIMFPSDCEIVGLRAFGNLYQKTKDIYDGYEFVYYKLNIPDRNIVILDIGNELFQKGIYDESIKEFLYLPVDLQPTDKIKLCNESLNNRIGKAFDFEDGKFDNWKQEGEAFSNAPTTRAALYQGPVGFWQGRFFANSYSQGTDKKEGVLISEPFIIKGDEISFLIAGGNHPEDCFIQLISDSKTLFKATGDNSEEFRLVKWRHKYPIVGQTARIEIIDHSIKAWGHIMVDNIRQYNLGK